ncbi:MAG: O-antigen ligase family protein [Alphaproteobacteria bacterium]|nr:O-antigen ligase family protein [Alphaproteobacteria bacterium]
MRTAWTLDRAWFVVQRRLEFAFVVVALMLLMGALRPFFSGFDLGGGATSISGAIEGNRLYQVSVLPIYMIAAAALVAYCWGKLLSLVRTNLLLCAFVLLVALSPLWAEMTNLGIRRSFALVGNTLIAFYIVCRFSPEEFLRLLGWAMALTLSINILAAVFITTGMFAGSGAFRGVHGHKNDFGQVMVLGAIVFWTLRSVDGWRGFPALTGFALCTVFAFWSFSASAWVIYSGLLLIALPLLRQMSSGAFTPSLRVIWMSICVMFLIVLLLLFYQTGLEFIGKDVTLTNRTIIWEKSLKFGWERPWLGSGYGTFWEGWAGRAWLLHGSRIGHAHNAFVDIWLHLGFVGAGLLVLILVQQGLRLVPLIIYLKDRMPIFYGLILAYVVTYSMVVKIVPDHRRVIWTILVASMLYASIAIRSRVGSPVPREPKGMPA